MQVLGRSRGGEGVLILDVSAITANHSGSAALFLLKVMNVCIV